MIEEASSGVIQNAADVFQKNILKGLVEVFPNEVRLINLPFVGSYPKRFNKIYFPSTNENMFKSLPVLGLGFINVTFVKFFSRFINLFKKLVFTKDIKNSFVVIYSLHMPFIMAVVLVKKILFSDCKVCIVVPDLPEYMSEQGGFIYNTAKKVESFLLELCIPHVDKYILLTEGMSERFSLKSEQYIVIEGISDLNDYENQSNVIYTDVKYVFYSGTLAKRYGIRDLVDAFIEIAPERCELWICGDGDSKDYVKEKSKSESNIKYLGQLPRSEIIELQKNATVLVNPRAPEGEYTKYSFPSKVMEYMSSGRPVVMHKLPGIPSEYFEYCYTPSTPDYSGFVKCLGSALKLRDGELDATGLAARSFIAHNKTYIKQTEKIKNFLLR